MPKTTVVWKIVLGRTDEESNAHQARRSDMAEVIAGPGFRVHQTMVVNEEDSSVTVTRDWPDQATAEAWVNFVLADGAIFARVDPE